MARTSVVWDLIARDNASKTFSKINAQAGHLRLGIGAIGKAAGLLGGVFAAVGGVEVFKKFIDDATESRKVARQTNAVLKSTGAVAGVSAGHVAKLAGKLSMISGVDDEIIQSGENVLLTFKGIRNGIGKNNKIFDQATKVTLDMSAALGQDLQSSVIQVGKALNDPIRGLTALQRVGVTFTEQQKKQITTLVKNGKTMQAQKIILRELKSEFGGAAKAAANPWDKVKVALGNVSEAIGGQLLPYTDKVANWLVKRLPAATNKAIHVLKPLGKALSLGVKFSLGGIGKAIDFATDVKKGLTTAVGSSFKTIKYAKGRTLNIPTQFTPKTPGEKLGAAIRNMFTGKGIGDFSSIVDGWISKLNKALRKVDWMKVGNVIGTLLSKAIATSAVVIAAVSAAMVKLMLQVNWNQVASAAVIGLVTGLFTGLYRDIRGAGKTYGPGIEKSIEDFFKGLFSDKGNDFWHGITVPLVKGFFTGFKNKWVDMVASLVSLPHLIISIFKRGFGISSPSRVFQTIGRQLVQGLVNGVTGWWNKHVTPWFRGRKAAILSWFNKTGQWLYGKGQSIITGFRNGIQQAWGPTSAWLKNTKNRVLTWFAHTGTWIYGKGQNLMTGFWNGMKQPWDNIKSWVSQIAKTIKSLKGPLAADKKLLVPEGKAIMGGLLKGIQSGFGPVAGAVSGIGGSIGQILAGVAAKFGWGSGPQLAALKWIVAHESGGRPTAQNPRSTAYGLFQFLNGTWATVGGHKTSNPVLQTLYGLRYIKGKYGSPLGAMAFWQRHHWYAKGTAAAQRGWAWVGEHGPELMRMRGGEQILSNQASMAKTADASTDPPGPIVLELRSSGREVDEMLLRILRKAIRVRGGNVQLVVGG